jgi:hypothetical protein
MSKKDVSGNKDVDIMLNNREESYRIIRNQKMTVNHKGNKKCLIDYEENKDNNDTSIAKRKRSNSINLYKKQRKNKERRNKKRVSRKELEKSIEKENKIEKQNSNNLRNKKVTFLKPHFVTIIDVESYKKFNMENTCKDPFEDMEYINNMNLDHINKNIKNIEDEEEGDGKERLQCTCSIF